MLCQILQPQRASLPRCLLHSCVISQERTVSAKSKNLSSLFFPPQNAPRVQRISFAASDFSVGTQRNFLQLSF